MARVAFIGLGRMGHGMAGRYLDAGFTVTVWNRSRAKAEDLIARGAQWATSPEDAAIDADAVVTMVADDAASHAVWLGKDGAAANMKAGLQFESILKRGLLEYAFLLPDHSPEFRYAYHEVIERSDHATALSRGAVAGTVRKV